MPDSCCAIGCQNRRTGSLKTLPFYNIPSRNTPIDKRRRFEWIKALRREDWKHWPDNKISKQKVCGQHFVSGRRSEDSNDIDWVPTKFVYNKDAEKSATKKRKIRTRYCHINDKRLKNELPSFQESADPGKTDDVIDDITETEKLTESEKEVLKLKETIKSLQNELTERNKKMFYLQKENEMLKGEKSRHRFGYNKIKDNDKTVNFYTGVPTSAVFDWLLDLIKDSVKLFHSSLSCEDHLLIVLMKLKLGLMNRDLAYRFDVPECTISKIYRLWLTVLAGYMKHLIVWPDRVTIRQNLPECFARKFRDCVCIIDCSEIFIERPSCLTPRAQSWSNYKHNNTVKYLIGISPAGAVSFLSEGWGGRVSDKQITSESGFIDKLSTGDCILADRGFLIHEELEKKGAVLKIPSFTKGKSQLSASDVDESRQLAHVRIHVERVIGRLKDFHILQNIIPISQVDLIDKMMVVICAAINLNKSVVGGTKR